MDAEAEYSGKHQTAVETLKRIIGQNPDDITEKIKWQLSYTAKNSGRPGGVPFEPQRVEMQIDGLLRGDFAERLSAEIATADAETVFTTGTGINELKIKTFSEIARHTTKEGILAFAVRKSLEEKPPENLIKFIGNAETDDLKRKAAIRRISEEIVTGYSAKGRAPNSGILYADTVIPDAALIDGAGNVTGLVEIKAYFPEELGALLDHLRKLKSEGKLKKPNDSISVRKNGLIKNLNLGPELEGETEFVDSFRNVGYGLPSLKKDMPILLRFPADISDSALAEYGEIVHSLGYSNLTIQKLPVTCSELTAQAKKFVSNNLDSIMHEDARLHYSKREIKVLQQYAKNA